MIYGIWTFCAALLAFIISAVTGKFLIPYLRKLHFGQTILEEGPKWHKGKQGTPTMGGIMFIVAIVVVTMISTVIYAFTGADLVNSFFADIPRECMFIFCGLGLAVANGFIGFIDDYIKVVKKRNLGLTASQKLILQFLVAAAFLAVLAIAGYGTTTTIPFVGKVDLGFFYYIIAAVAIVGIVNSVNLTDGIDGLDGSVTFFACVAFMLIACVKSYLGITAMSAASAGACLGFLVWNFHPAKVFIGRTRVRLFLRRSCMCSCFCQLICLFFLFRSALSILLRSFPLFFRSATSKYTHGKRLFKMSPIHHHFEMCGWSEVKIVGVFSAVTAVFGAIAFCTCIFWCINKRRNICLK